MTGASRATLSYESPSPMAVRYSHVMELGSSLGPYVLNPRFMIGNYPLVSGLWISRESIPRGHSATHENKSFKT